MTHIKMLFCLSALAIGAHAETFTVDIDHSEIGFKVRHLMLSDVKGSFNSFVGSVEYDPEAGKLVSIEGSITAASIDTNSEKRDDHLRNDDFFNVAEFPNLKFKSTSIQKTGDDTYTVKGKLTLLGVVREVSLPVSVSGPIEDPWGNQRIALSCSTELNRRDLGITNSPAAIIGDEVKVSINAQAVMAAE